MCHGGLSCSNVFAVPVNMFALLLLFALVDVVAVPLSQITVEVGIMAILYFKGREKPKRSKRG